MTVSQKLLEEGKALGVAMLFFAAWFGAFLLLKNLILAEYRIGAVGWSMALIGALVLAKVVLILEHVPLGRWVRERPAWVGIALRTLLYTAGVFVVMVLEKSFEGRHEHGGLAPALAATFREAEFHHVLANTICVAGALLTWNTLAVVRRHLGPGGLPRLLLSPPGAGRRDQA